MLFAKAFKQSTFLTSKADKLILNIPRNSLEWGNTVVRLISVIMHARVCTTACAQRLEHGKLCMENLAAFYQIQQSC